MGAFQQIANWQFVVASLCVMAVMTGLKQATIAGAPGLLTRGWFKSFMAVQNLLWGLVVAIPHGFLVGDRYSERAIVGIVAGFFSHWVYHLVLKRFRVLSGEQPGAVPQQETNTGA